MTAHLLLTKCRPGSLGANEQSNGVGLFVGEPAIALKTDQQVRLHLNRFSPTTVEGQARASLAFNVQLLEDKAC